MGLYRYIGKDCPTCEFQDGNKGVLFWQRAGEYLECTTKDHKFDVETLNMLLLDRCEACKEPAITTITREKEVPVCLRHYNRWEAPTPIHYMTDDSGGLTSCCGKTVFELPRFHRLTTNKEMERCNVKSGEKE